MSVSTGCAVPLHKLCTDVPLEEGRKLNLNSLQRPGNFHNVILVSMEILNTVKSHCLFLRGTVSAKDKIPTVSITILLIEIRLRLTHILKSVSYTSPEYCREIFQTQIKSINSLLESVQTELCCHLLYSISYCKKVFSNTVHTGFPSIFSFVLIHGLICMEYKWRKMPIKCLSKQYSKTKAIWVYNHKKQLEHENDCHFCLFILNESVLKIVTNNFLSID